MGFCNSKWVNVCETWTYCNCIGGGHAKNRISEFVKILFISNQNKCLHKSQELKEKKKCFVYGLKSTDNIYADNLVLRCYHIIYSYYDLLLYLLHGTAAFVLYNNNVNSQGP